MNIKFNKLKEHLTEKFPKGEYQQSVLLYTELAKYFNVYNTGAEMEEDLMGLLIEYLYEEKFLEYRPNWFTADAFKIL